MNNATSALSTINDFSGMFITLLAIIMGITLIIILLTIANNITNYQRFKKFLSLILPLLNYTAYGLLTILVIGGPCLLAWTILQHASENPTASITFLKYSSIIIGGFALITTIGYVTKNRIWTRLYSYHQQEVNTKKYAKKYKENIKELPGDIQ